MLLHLLVHLGKILLSFLPGLSEQLFGDLLTAVGVSLEGSIVRGGSQSFPVHLSELLQGSNVIFLESHELLAHNLDLVQLLRLVPWSHQENKSFSLLRRQSKISEVKVNFSASVTEVDSSGLILALVVRGKLVEV